MSDDEKNRADEADIWDDADVETWGDDEDVEEFLRAWDEADKDAADLLQEACADTFAAQPPQPDLADACEHLRTGLARRRWPYDYFVHACGWQGGAVPADDQRMWLEAAAATISPPEDPQTPVEQQAAVGALMHADWFGVVVGLVRRGPGAAFDGVSASRDIAEAPEIEDESDDPEGDDEALEMATVVLSPLWQALQVLDDADRLTPLGAWGLPHALMRVWTHE